MGFLHPFLLPPRPQSPMISSQNSGRSPLHYVSPSSKLLLVPTLSRINSEIVTVIYKIPQDLAPSDPISMALSFIHSESAMQASSLFLEDDKNAPASGPLLYPPLPSPGLECFFSKCLLG